MWYQRASAKILLCHLVPAATPGLYIDTWLIHRIRRQHFVGWNSRGVEAEERIKAGHGCHRRPSKLPEFVKTSAASNTLDARSRANCRGAGGLLRNRLAQSLLAACCSQETQGERLHSYNSATLPHPKFFPLRELTNMGRPRAI